MEEARARKHYKSTTSGRQKAQLLNRSRWGLNAGQKPERDTTMPGGGCLRARQLTHDHWQNCFAVDWAVCFPAAWRQVLAVVPCWDFTPCLKCFSAVLTFSSSTFWEISSLAFLPRVGWEDRYNSHVCHLISLWCRSRESISLTQHDWKQGKTLSLAHLQ